MGHMPFLLLKQQLQSTKVKFLSLYLLTLNLRKNTIHMASTYELLNACVQ